MECDKLILKFTCKSKGPRKSLIVLKKRGEVGRCREGGTERWLAAGQGRKLLALPFIRLSIKLL